jgi:hypothetical protein
MKLIHISAAAAVLAFGPLTAQAESCTYIQESMWAGPFKVCDMPADAARCEALGKEDDNRDAVHSSGSCATEGVVGTCGMGGVQRLYYEGDPAMLEIGCSFQNGDWNDG